ncbi:hypothetical protein D1614_12895 [Maribellus luteus]|uniref:Uncharacterized protein n=1 Tax=Maribellus luteus TaxID=2305463 RepID=A0A399SWX2_9BACT|nr:hypothetical protein [Maribellus luteus]RIJ48008.1 hypothetical protein D1614_12895 [Maribellus luteus]
MVPVHWDKVPKPEKDKENAEQQEQLRSQPQKMDYDAVSEEGFRPATRKKLLEEGEENVREKT